MPSSLKRRCAPLAGTRQMRNQAYALGSFARAKKTRAYFYARVFKF
jgi:hypothetical protein